MLSLTQPRNGSPNLTLRGMIPGLLLLLLHKHNNNHHHHTFNTSIRPESPKETRSPGNDVLDKAVADERSTWPVVLVSMPFMDVSRPSIQLGLLKSLAIAYGFPARTFHANLKFAKQIGVDYYQLLAEHRGHMVGEWLFSPKAFPGAAPDPDSCMVEELADGLSYLGLPQDELREKLTHTRHIDVPSYLEMLVDEFPWGEAAVVGFSSTFQQNTASFALARRLKQRYPHIFTVFGGANFDGEMGPEFVRTVHCIDAAVIGEGDDSFPRLLSALAAGSPQCRSRHRLPPGRAGHADTPAAADRPARRPAGTGLRGVLHPRGKPGHHLPSGAPEGLAPHRDGPGLLVGRQASLHVLRAERRDDAVPVQVTAARPRRARPAGAPVPELPVRGR